MNVNSYPLDSRDAWEGGSVCWRDGSRRPCHRCATQARRDQVRFRYAPLLSLASLRHLHTGMAGVIAPYHADWVLSRAGIVRGRRHSERKRRAA